MIERGLVTYPNRARQGRDFTGLRYGNITPTDIDAMIEYKNKAYVLIEAKHIHAPTMLKGQKLAYLRMCDDLTKIKPTLLIFCTHSHPLNEDIDFAACDVKAYRLNGRWENNVEMTVKELTDAFFDRVDRSANWLKN